jgi:hypothetical protein
VAACRANNVVSRVGPITTLVISRIRRVASGRHGEHGERLEGVGDDPIGYNQAGERSTFSVRGPFQDHFAGGGGNPAG